MLIQRQLYDKFQLPTWTICVFTMFITLCSCSKNNKVKHGEYLIRGDIKIENGDTILNGPIEFFNDQGDLIFISNYGKGLIHGISKEFFHGKIKQEVSYTYGEQNGFTLDYDSTGKLALKTNYFHGLTAGPQYFYRDDSLYQYLFVSLENLFLYKCSYENDTTILEKGNLLNYHAQQVQSEQGLEIELLIYKISPQHKRITYVLYDMNISTGDSSKVFQSNSDESFFEKKFLPYPMSGHKYYWEVSVSYPKHNVTIPNILPVAERELKIK